MADDEDDYYDIENADEEDEWENAMMDCGKMPDGTCTLAGSEFCDWDCPFSS